MEKTNLIRFYLHEKKAVTLKQEGRGTNILSYYEQHHLTEGVSYSHKRLHSKWEKYLSLKS